MRRIAGVTAAMVLAACVAARAETSTVQVYGPGISSCATYLRDKTLKVNADGWILGYWTGMNFEDEANHLVGKSTDSRGIVGAVVQACRAAPAMPLYRVARQVYQEMKEKGS